MPPLSRSSFSVLSSSLARITRAVPMTDQPPPKRRKLRIWLAVAGCLVVLAGIFIYLSEPKSLGVFERLQPGQTCDEAREILKDASWSGLPPASYAYDGRFLIFADGRFGEVTIGNGRVVKVESREDNGPFWDRARRGLEWRWYGFQQRMRGR
jgi:hypothetical protein